MAENCATGFDPAEDSYRIRLSEFDGPLDLLLHLIKKNEINIYDIPIATITKQYLDYIKMMKSLNLVVAGEFLVMAATLIHIKSRMLLPVESDGDIEDELAFSFFCSWEIESRWASSLAFSLLPSVPSSDLISAEMVSRMKSKDLLYFDQSPPSLLISTPFAPNRRASSSFSGEVVMTVTSAPILVAN